MRIFIVFNSEEEMILLVQFIKFHYIKLIVYDATVLENATPDRTNDDTVVPSAVSLIVPLFRLMFDPPTVRTSVLPKPALVFSKRFLFAVEPVAVYVSTWLP